MIRGGLIVMLAGFGLWSTGQGVYITAKAHFAQYLLEQAWEETLAGNAQVKPWPWADTWPMARLIFPTHDVEFIVLAGSHGEAMAFGPGHDSISVLPGEMGNSIIGGHRDTHFKLLQHLNVNDPIIIERPDGSRHTFITHDASVVDSRSTQLQLDSDSPRLTLVTCYPFGALEPGGPLRYVLTSDSPRLTLVTCYPFGALEPGGPLRYVLTSESPSQSQPQGVI